MTYVCLLRGVNVGGHAKLPMAEFRDLLGRVGATGVRTYVQSGNAVFEHGAREAAEVAILIADALRARFGFEISVLLLGESDLSEVVRAQPFAHEDPEEAKALHVGFMVAEPAGGVARSVAPPRGVGRDEFVLGGRVVYLRCPDGFGRTKLNGTFFERALGVPVTFRNWRTVLTLMEMAGAE